ncbi:haloacid dehalogenase [Aureimonas sp. SA4125]|uniref:HAD family hydrolase n=1 Tax=Aureimonas sp. SA4125 TaxID=2826993 RepID=UPI001CC43ECB|nr:HAD family hydrolase [Aureimonas sp. SA4125]BDA82942.1 haloacid dehalogenase [Aureimonas sp. SA4125]
MARPLVVFDLDDTLYLERDFARSGYKAVERVLGDRCLSEGFAELCLDLFDAGERGRIFDRALERIRLDPEPLLVAELVKAYRGHRPDIALAPDAERYLAARSGGIKGALITDGPAATQEAKISALGLGNHFGCIVCTGRLGTRFGKPHPRAFEIVERWAGPIGLPLVYVADNPRKDFVTPNIRGWATIQIERPQRVHRHRAAEPSYQAHASIESLDELDACLDAMRDDFRASPGRLWRETTA